MTGPERPPGTVRIVTWNVWWRFGPWEARQAAIAATLEAIEPDVVCLQEVWHDRPPSGGGVTTIRGGQAEMLAGALGFDHRFATVREPGTDVLFGNAILSRWPIAGADAFALPGHPGEPARRSGLRAVIDHGATTIPVICTHFDWEFTDSALRQRQAATIAARAAEVGGGPGTFPVVVGGDLNAVPDSDEIRGLTGRTPPGAQVFTDAWEVAGEGPGWTVDRGNPWVAENAWPRRRIDYVLVAWPRRAKPVGNVTAAHLAGADAVGGVVPSDHYAVVVDLVGP